MGSGSNDNRVGEEHKAEFTQQKPMREAMRENGSHGPMGPPGLGDLQTGAWQKGGLTTGGRRNGQTINIKTHHNREKPFEHLNIQEENGSLHTDTIGTGDEKNKEFLHPSP